MTELGIAHALKLLRSEGDEVEKFACDLNAVAPLIGQYAGIWANYIRPKREPGNPGLIQRPIKNFAERHYTALVRLLGALVAANRISDTCALSANGHPPGSTVVSVQSDLLAFFSSAGVAVENLEKAYSAPPLNSSQALMPEPSETIGSPKWFYDRRTQYVHKRLLPVFQIDGLLHLDLAHFIGKEVVWNDSSSNVQELSGTVEKLASLLVSGLAKGWSRLHSTLRSTAAVPLGGITPIVSFTSGSPRHR